MNRFTLNLLSAFVLLKHVTVVNAQKVMSVGFADVMNNVMFSKSATQGNTVIDFEALGTDKINIDFVTNRRTESVLITMEGTSLRRCESLAPFSLFPEENGRVLGEPFEEGVQRITAIPYPRKLCRGRAGNEFEHSFRVVATNNRKSPPQSPPKATQDRPNLVVIMTDQQRYDALSLAGNTIVDTPNMDRIGREGAFFTNAYTSAPVCGPARTSLFTGLSIENTGVRRNKDEGNKGIRSYDEHLVFHEGYAAEYHGKWHSPKRMAGIYNNNPDTKSFNIFRPYRFFLEKSGYSIPASPVPQGLVIDTLSQQSYRPNSIDTRFGREDLNITPRCECDQYGVSEIDPEHTLDAFYGTNAIRALRRLSNQDKPFTLHCSFNNPHAPHTPPKLYADMFKASDMPVPPSIGDLMIDSPYQDMKNARYSDPSTIGDLIAVYYSQVKEADHWVGQILDTLDQRGLTNNTMVIFTADHGEMMGSHGLIEKNVFYEESVHIPMMIRFPGAIPKGTKINAPVSHRDLFPTIFDYLGAKQRRESDGTSLRRYIENQPISDNEPPFVVSESGRFDQLMILSGYWKLIIPNSADSDEPNVLFNLKGDPHEMENLIGRSNPRRTFNLHHAERLRATLVRWCTKVNSPHTNNVRNRVL